MSPKGNSKTLSHEEIVFACIAQCQNRICNIFIWKYIVTRNIGCVWLGCVFIYTYTQTYTNIMYCWKEGHADSWKRSTRSVYPCYCLYNKQCSLLSVFPIVRNPGFLLLYDKFTYYDTKLKFEIQTIEIE